MLAGRCAQKFWTKLHSHHEHGGTAFILKDGNYPHIYTSQPRISHMHETAVWIDGLQQGSLSSNPRTAIHGWKSERFLSFRVITIFVEMELLNYTPTGWTELDHVNFVLCNYVILTHVSVPPDRHELSFCALYSGGSVPQLPTKSHNLKKG
jgi:hypothetical protein